MNPKADCMKEENTEVLENIMNGILDVKKNTDELPPSRESAILRTKLDEARLWLSELINKQLSL